MIKKFGYFIIIILALVFCSSFSFAQDDEKIFPPLQNGFGLFALSQDNVFAWEVDKGAFLAIGGGVDFMRYEKPMSWGGILSLTGHATLASQVTGPDIGGVFAGLGVNVDLVKMINGTGVEFLMKDLKLLVGPTAGIDMATGKFAGGVCMFLTYSFQ